MRQVFEDEQAVLDDLVRLLALHVGDEADAAGIVLVARIVETLRGGVGSACRFGRTFWRQPLSSARPGQGRRHRCVMSVIVLSSYRPARRALILPAGKRLRSHLGPARHVLRNPRGARRPAGSKAPSLQHGQLIGRPTCRPPQQPDRRILYAESGLLCADKIRQQCCPKFLMAEIPYRTQDGFTKNSSMPRQKITLTCQTT